MIMITAAIQATLTPTATAVVLSAPGAPFPGINIEIHSCKNKLTFSRPNQFRSDNETKNITVCEKPFSRNCVVNFVNFIAFQ